MKLRHGVFAARDLRLVAPAPPPDAPPLGVGDRCRLVSGGPELLVVDVAGDAVVCAWDDGASEEAFRRGTVRRVG